MTKPTTKPKDDQPTPACPSCGANPPKLVPARADHPKGPYWWECKACGAESDL